MRLNPLEDGVGPAHAGMIRDRARAPYFADANGDARVELIAHARTAGRSNLPESAAREPNDVEAALIREHQRRHRDLVEQTRGELRSLVDAFDNLEQQLPRARDLEVVVEQASAAIEHDLAADQALSALRQEQQRRRRDLRAFERENSSKVTGPAHYPASRLFHLGTVAILVVVESLLNAGFFAGGSNLGLLGGFFMAVGVSLTNVALGLTAGFFARWRNARTPLPRRLAAFGIAVFAAVVVLFNVAVAHIRDQALSGGSLAALLAHPWAISFPSAVLLVVGVLASLIAARKGWTLDAAVPGHGDVDRAFCAADRAHREHHQQLRRLVLEHAERVPQTCRGIVDRAQDLTRQLGALVVRAERTLEAYEAERERIARWCHQWLKRYRDENAAVRSARVPAYFADFPAFPSEVGGLVVEQLQQRLVAAQGRLESLRAKAHEIALEQPTRVTGAGQRFEAFSREAIEHADAGRGDGSAGLGRGAEQRGTAA